MTSGDPLGITVITIFPEYFAGSLGLSIPARAAAAGAVRYRIIDLRDFTHDRHRTVDDVPFARELPVNELERDLPVHRMLDGGVDDAHAATAEHARDRVAPARDRPADDRIRGLCVAGVVLMLGIALYAP